MNNQWRIEIEDWRSISVSAAKTIFEEAKEHFDFTHEIAEKITSRAFSLLILLVPIFSLYIGLFIRIDKATTPEAILYVLVALVFVVCLMMLLYIIFPHLYMFPGREPKELFEGNFFDLELEDQELAIVLNEIEACQFKIDVNSKSNSRRLQLLKWVIYVLVAALIAIAILCYSLISGFL